VSTGRTGFCAERFEATFNNLLIDSVTCNDDVGQSGAFRRRRRLANALRRLDP
jgi:hypothetical protein